MGIALVFRLEGVWSLLTVALLVTLNTPLLMIIAAAVAMGMLESFALLFADYVLFHWLVYVASSAAVLLRLTHLVAEHEGES